MDKPRFILDSNVLIDTLNHKLDLEAFLDGLPPDCELYINLVTEIEVLAKPGMDAKEEAEARSFLDGFLWAEIDKPTRDEAILIRRSKDKPLRLPDALIAASSVMLKAVVLSNDPHLRDYQWPGYAAQPCGSPEDTR
jgi:predicted nucleic acid-binding protein